ncbi:MAG: hypothetical protein B7Z73_08740 [Planctomycetia bacterium 21-64-5]|nr:MAG: hypothetical protein B7Z73_08740 [Planctomycetia bacterium 21-64-5]HQU45382.1 hypothetical protein [Pirellulales bacterium]
MKRNDDNAKNRIAGKSIRCANCGSLRVTTTEIDDAFDFGEGPFAVSLQVRVPLRTCQDCGFQFLDEEAEDLRQEVIAEHQAALYPGGD